MQTYVDLLNKTKEASGIVKLCHSSANSNLGKLITTGQKKKKTLRNAGLKRITIKTIT